jgi:hypothetical protein
MKAMTAVKCEGTCHNKRQYDDFDPLLNRALSEAFWLLSKSNRTREGSAPRSQVDPLQT